MTVNTLNFNSIFKNMPCGCNFFSYESSSLLSVCDKQKDEINCSDSAVCLWDDDKCSVRKEHEEILDRRIIECNKSSIWQTWAGSGVSVACFTGEGLKSFKVALL